MAEDAGQVVIEIVAKLDGVVAGLAEMTRALGAASGSAGQSAGAIESSLRQLGDGASAGFQKVGASAKGAADDVGASSGKAKESALDLLNTLGDISADLASGKSPFELIASQGPDVIEALVAIASSGEKLGTVLKGVALPGFFAVLTILAPLIAKLFDLGGTSEDAAERARRLGIAQDGLGDTSLSAANAVDVLNRAQLSDQSRKLADDANSLADARIQQATATYNAARAEAQLRKANAQARLADAADGAVKEGRTVRQLSTQRGRAGSELSRYEAQAKKDAADADADLQKLEAAFEGGKKRILSQALNSDRELRESRLRLAAATSESERAQEQANITIRKAKILVDAHVISETEYGRRSQEAKASVEAAQASESRSTSARRTSIEVTRELGTVIRDTGTAAAEEASKIATFQTQIADSAKAIHDNFAKISADNADAAIAQIAKNADVRGKEVMDAGAKRDALPGHQYVRLLDPTPEERKKQIDEKAVGYLKTFNENLTKSAKSALHLHGILGDIVGDLIDMAIKQGLIKPLADVLFGANGGGVSGGGGLLGKIAGVLGGLFGGVGGGGFDIGAVDPGPQLPGFNRGPLIFDTPGFASGGSFRIGGRSGVDRNVLSLNGEPVAKVSRGETAHIVPQAKRLSQGAGRVMRPQAAVTVISAPQFDLSQAVTTPELLREVGRVSRENANTAAAAMGRSVMKAVPARVSQYQNDGS